ncbi:MAG: hypothetical protein K2J15_01295 [Muribaculaceae bacterium]|nr:hypothetical protein [Muribaculaceae bacterium]
MRKFLTTLLLLLAVFPLCARYSVHSVSQGVMVESAGKQSAATSGMTLKPSDHLIIPKGGKVEIYNDLDKKIYTSVAEGKVTVTRLMIDARSAAADNRGNVGSRLRFARSNESSDQRLYVQKGMVKRSLGILDPEGEKIVADPSLIARFIASRIANGDDELQDTLPVPVEHSATPEGGMIFDLRNTIGFPVYFNVVKVSRKGDRYNVRISEIGQPAGSYVLLPDQTIARGHYASVPDDELHLLVMTHCQYDIDEMIDELQKALGDTAGSDSSFATLPIYLLRL